MRTTTCFLILIMLLLACDDDFEGDELEISIPVSVMELKPGSIEEYVTASATVQAKKSAVMNSEIEGKYRLANNSATGKPFAPGDKVRAGQVVVYLDNQEHENTIRIKSKELNLELSQRELEKQESLYEKGGVTLRELKNAESARIDAQYDYDNATLQLGKMQITAPFDGVIVDLPYYTPQTRVASGLKMAEFMDYRELYAEVQYPASELSRIEVGQRVNILHYSQPEDTLSGTVTRVAPTLDPVARTFEAFLTIENDDLILRPGMFVKIDAIVEERTNTLVIPREVIIERRRGNTVYVEDKGSADERIVTIGLENDALVEVIEGLTYNELLIVKGYETLRDRSKVEVVK